MRKITSLLLCILLVCSLSATALAAGGSISAGASSAKPGDTVTFTFNFSSGEPVAILNVFPQFCTTCFSNPSGNYSSCNSSCSSLSYRYSNGAFVAYQGENTVIDGSGTLTLTVNPGACAAHACSGVYATIYMADRDGQSLTPTPIAPAKVEITHAWGDWTVTSPASCTQEGSQKRTCTACGETETASLPMLEHTPGDWNVTKEATCTADGEKVRSCTVCGTTIGTEAIPATGHTYGPWSVEVPATCKDEGKEVQVCGQCGDKQYRSIDKLTTHTWSEWLTDTPAGCTTEGSQHRTCSVCGIMQSETIPAKGHAPSEDSVVVPATCETEGSITGKCKECGEVLEHSVIPALGHEWGEWTVKTAATCEAGGEEIRTCSHGCGKTESRPTEALGHSWGKWTENTETGKHDRTCPRCQKVETADHKWNSGMVTKPATCNEDGVKTFTCTDCGAARTEAIPATNEHNYSDHYEVIDGSTHKAFCACGESKVETHVYSQEGEVLEPPTTTKEGRKEMLCVCGAKTEVSIPKKNADLDHVPKTGDITGQLIGGGAAICVVIAGAFILLCKKKVQ